MKGRVLFSNPYIYPPIGLRPEMVKTWEIGVDASLFNNRLRIDAAYYDKLTTDQIMEANRSATVASKSSYPAISSRILTD